MTNTYMHPRYAGQEQLTEAIEANDVERLREMIIAAALHEEDFDFASSACVRLSRHTDEFVRGNAVLGLGHIARLFGRLGTDAVETVKTSLDDPSGYVRGQAHAAAGDLAHFLGIEVRRPEEQ